MPKPGKLKDQTAGRRADAALPLGEGEGADSAAKVERVGRRERRTAGPDAQTVGRPSGGRPLPDRAGRAREPNADCA